MKLALLGLLEQAVAGGWSREEARRVLGLDERRARRQRACADAGARAELP